MVTRVKHSKKEQTRKKKIMTKGKRKKAQKPQKWSNRYKKSIDCDHPKGFSQKQYCQFGRSHQ
jgi:hypothetical protein